MIFDDFSPLCLVASHTRSKGDTGIRNEEWWEMLKKVSNIVKSHFFPAQGFRSFWHLCTQDWVGVVWNCIGQRFYRMNSIPAQPQIVWNVNRLHPLTNGGALPMS